MIWKAVKDHAVKQRREEELLFELAVEEYETGRVRKGLMAKALDECDGDEKRASHRYLKLLAETLRDEQYMAQRFAEEVRKAEDSERINAEEQRNNSSAKTSSHAARHISISRTPIQESTKRDAKKGSSLAWVIVFLALLAFGAVFIGMATSSRSSYETYYSDSDGYSDLMESTSNETNSANTRPECTYETMDTTEDWIACGYTPEKQ